MKSFQLKEWRQSLGLGQKELAEQLGLKRRVVQYYEKGERNGKAIEIPKQVTLACYSITCGVADFDGRTVEWGEAKAPRSSE